MARRRPCSIVNLWVAVANNSGVNMASWPRAQRFSVKQRRVCSAQQILGFAAMMREDACPHAGANHHLATVYEQRPLEYLDELVTGCRRRFFGCCILVDHREFIATQTAGEPKGLSGMFQALRDARQHLIAKSVSHAVVEILEVIDIDEKDTDMMLILRRAFQCMIQQNEQLPSIRQMRERIVFREVLQLTRSLLDFFLKTFLIIAGHVTSGGKLRCHSVEA